MKPFRARPRPPLGVAMQFQAALAARWERVATLCKRIIVAQWHTNYRAHGIRRHKMRADAMRSPWIEARLREVTAALRGENVAAPLLTWTAQVDAQNGREFRRLVPIRFRADPEVGPLLDRFRSEALSKIRSLDEDGVDDLREVLEEAEAGEWAVADLADAIEERLGVASSKAELLARDQTLKMNAAITKERHTASGITQYIWRGSLDGRERETHTDLEGEVCDWDDPPETNDDGDTNHPGEDFQCRCTPEPILPDDDAEDATAEGDDEDEESGDEYDIAAE